MKRYWKSIDEYKGNSNVEKTKEIKNDLSDLFSLKNANRRDFLKVFGFSLTTAALASSCERPVSKAIPYLIKPEEITPGKASYYASSYYDGDQYNSILVKTRDGRPIKIEGNDLSPISYGATSAIVQASVLSLYDTSRYPGPRKENEVSDYATIDAEIVDKLTQLSEENKKVVLLTSSLISPSTYEVIKVFTQRYPAVEHIIYDAVPLHGILTANEKCFGKRMIPSYHFNKADYILNFGADFMGSWISPVEFTRQFSEKRNPDHKTGMSKLVQIESEMSLTGSNADYRYPVKPSQIKTIVAAIFAKLSHNDIQIDITEDVDIEHIVQDLHKYKGKSLVISGSNDPELQIMINGINQSLSNYGATIDLTAEQNLKQGDDRRLSEFLSDMKERKISGLLMFNVNPVYDLPNGPEFESLLKNLDISVSFSSSLNETASVSKFVCPDSHYLESWNDAQPKTGHYSLQQPAIHPIFDTRQFQDTLLKWSGEKIKFIDFIKKYWETNLYPISKKENQSFNDYWNNCLHDGTLNTIEKIEPPQYNTEIATNLLQEFKTPEVENVEISTYQKTAIGSGKNSNNPWLQETPDPVSKICWDNYACISPSFAEQKQLSDGDIIKVNNIEIPVFVQPGQAQNTLSIALGYGRKTSGKAARNVGVNAYPLMPYSGDFRADFIAGTIEKTEKKYEFAQTQMHHSLEGRPLARETVLDAYIKDPAAGNEMHEKVEHHHTTLYPEHEFKGHHWGLAIDLTLCNGCSTCVVACNAENNVSVVGKKEVQRGHEMHWIRVDRYYSGSPENPEVIRQPVMCQHCNHAPCENVCPVSATNHSDEGINQMAYNRCIGTRYCDNNCPYKVRRFNWFDYNKADSIPYNTKDELGLSRKLPRMVLNPDVTVRAKGVMEKCSFCIQRIQEKKLEAKLENRPLKDGEIKMACQQSCPAGAIVFGDMNDPESKISKLFGNARNYHLLEEIHTLPTVGYLTKVRNKENNKDNNVRITH